MRGSVEIVTHISLARREFLIGAGALVVVANSALLCSPADAQKAPVAEIKSSPDPAQLDSWIAVDRAGQVTAYLGRPDVGLGVDVAVAQIVADELDVPIARVTILGGDTALTCNQGGVSASNGVQVAGRQLRLAAAEARRLLLEQAAQRLNIPVAELNIVDGVVAGTGAEVSRSVSYAELVGNGQFKSGLDWNGKLGNALAAPGKAKPKAPDQYRLVGKSEPRRDIAGKVFGSFEYISDFRVPGMLHGRVIRPRLAGAVPASVDETSLTAIPGARVVHRGDFIGVVANNEWDAIRASRALRVVWSEARPPFFDDADLYAHIRRTPAAARQIVKETGEVDAAFRNSTLRIVEAEYEWPYQSHASIAPACAVADVRREDVVLWHSSQKPHAVRESVAKLLGRGVDAVRSISMGGPGSYGRNDASDAAADAAVLSAATGRPVRLQGDRSDAQAWDPKGPASVHTVRAAIDRDGRIIAYNFMSKGFSRGEVAFIEMNPYDLLAGQLMGFDPPVVNLFGIPEEAYEIANRRMGWETIPTLLAKASPLRTSHLRDPLGPQMHFASEVFMDECAFALELDPIDFRLRNIRDPRHRKVIETVARSANWKAGAPGSRSARSDIGATGRGFAYTQSGETIVAVIADVVVDSISGRVRPIGFHVAHDCGLIVNPLGLTRCIEGNVVQAASRALFEEVRFDAKSVTSNDWNTYRILDIMEAPERIDVALINRSDLPASGAGEPSTRPIAAAICNAIFDATGRRLRRAPFTPERVKAA